MTLSTTLVSPYAPRVIRGGGSVGGKAIFVEGSTNYSVSPPQTPERFCTATPSGVVEAFSITPPPGAYRGGITRTTDIIHNGGVLVFFGGLGNTAGALWAAHIFPDGTVDAYPSPYSMYGGTAVKVGGDVWVMSEVVNAIRVFNLTTMTWTTTIGGGNIVAVNKPIYIGGFVYVGNEYSQIMKIDPVTHTRVVAGSGLPTSAGIGQTAYHPDGNAYWTSGTSTFVRISPDGNITFIRPGVTGLGPAICVDSNGYLRSTNTNNTVACGWNPVTGHMWQESTGYSPGSNSAFGYVNFAVGDVVISAGGI